MQSTERNGTSAGEHASSALRARQKGKSHDRVYLLESCVLLWGPRAEKKQKNACQVSPLSCCFSGGGRQKKQPCTSPTSLEKKKKSKPTKGDIRRQTGRQTSCVSRFSQRCAGVDLRGVFHYLQHPWVARSPTC